MRRSLKLAIAFVAAALACVVALPVSVSAFEVEGGTDLPASIADSIPDDARLVSADYAVLTDGTVVKVSDASVVTDPELVGDGQSAPDPLALTGGKRRLDMTVGEAREQIAAQASEPAAQSATDASAYGAYWSTYNAEKAFCDEDGNIVSYNAKTIIDVSQWDRDIDWEAVKNDGVDGVIIRIGYGFSSIDPYAQRNINECKRLGIPFGVYFFSYADTAELGTTEGYGIVSLLQSLGVSPSDLSYPVYYDLEWFEYSDGTGYHENPSDNWTYTGIAQNCLGVVESAGYSNTGIYTGASMLWNTMFSDYLRQKATWVAQYNGTFDYDGFWTTYRAWQYTLSCRVNGIDAEGVDVSAFGYSYWPDNDHDGVDLNSLGTRVYDLEEGDYTLRSSMGDLMVDIAWDSSENGAHADVWPYNGNANQVFHIAPVGDGTYTIRSTSSGLYLDAWNAETFNGTAVIQWEGVWRSNQFWELYRASDGTYYIANVNAASRNKVIDVYGASTDAGTKLALWAALGGANQRFEIRKVGSSGDSSAVVESGHEQFDEEGGSWQWVYADGSIAKNEVIYVASGRKWCYYDASGAMVHGEAYLDYDTEHTGWYLFDEVTGAMQYGVRWLDASSKWVYYDSVTGKMTHGEALISYDAEHTGWYLFDEVTGAMYHGDTYVRSNGGKWVRYDYVTGKMVHGLQYFDGSWYYFDSVTGAMAHGNTWVSDWGVYHNFDEVTGRG